MSISRSLCLMILISFLLSLTVGLSYGVEEVGDFSLPDFKTRKNVSFQDILLTNANVLVVTETNCYSCIKEIQSLEWIRAKYKGDMAVVVNFVDRDGWNRVERYLKYYNFDLDMFLVDNENQIPKIYSIDYIPTMIIFDSDGNERFRKKGFSDGDESNISKKIDEVIGVRVPEEAEAEAAHVEKPTAAKTPGCATTG